MMVDMADIIGTTGVLLILLCYYLLQARHLTIEHPYYSLLNLIGSVLIMYSLCFHWNTPSFIIEVVWIGISIWGLYKAFFKISKE
jgi:hypothetical protein